MIFVQTWDLAAVTRYNLSLSCCNGFFEHLIVWSSDANFFKISTSTTPSRVSLVFSTQKIPFFSVKSFCFFKDVLGQLNVDCLSSPTSFSRRYHKKDILFEVLWNLPNEKLKLLNIFESLYLKRISFHTSQVPEVSQLSVAGCLKWKQIKRRKQQMKLLRYFTNKTKSKDFSRTKGSTATVPHWKLCASKNLRWTYQQTFPWLPSFWNTGFKMPNFCTFCGPTDCNKISKYLAGLGNETWDHWYSDLQRWSSEQNCKYLESKMKLSSCFFKSALFHVRFFSELLTIPRLSKYLCKYKIRKNFERATSDLFPSVCKFAK